MGQSPGGFSAQSLVELFCSEALLSISFVMPDMLAGGPACANLKKSGVVNRHRQTYLEHGHARQIFKQDRNTVNVRRRTSQ
jgi:hypothetical protein